jgi:hypothetical protein
MLAPVLDVIRSGAFRRRVDELGGYDTAIMGEVVAEVT